MQKYICDQKTFIFQDFFFSCCLQLTVELRCTVLRGVAQDVAQHLAVGVAQVQDDVLETKIFTPLNTCPADER